MIKRITIYTLFAALLFSTTVAHSARGKQVGIAAIVNDEVVTFSDVNDRMQLYLLGKPPIPNAAARRMAEQQTLDRLINETLQMQEAKALGITVNETDLQEAFAQIANQNGLPDETFKQKLMKSGINIRTLHDQLRAEIAWAQVVRRKLRPQINVSENEIDDALAQMSRSNARAQYHVAEIFLPVKSVGMEKDVQKEAEKLVEHITGGASFSSVAREFSKAPGAVNGGDLGWIQEDQIDRKLASALMRMKTGQLSPPVRTAKGYHILFLRDKRTPHTAAAAQKKVSPPAPVTTTETTDTIVHLKQILIPVDEQEPQAVVNAKVMRAASLKAEIANCAQMDIKAKDFSSPATGDLGKLVLEKLPGPIIEAIEPLTIGDLSPPIRTQDGIAVIMVCARKGGTKTVHTTPAVPAPAPPAQRTIADASRDDIANRIGMQRLEQMQERYLRDLRAAAFIDKRI